MKTLSLSTLGILLVAYIVIGALLFLSQRKFIYFPTSAIKHGYPEEIFKTGTESIVVAVVNGGREKALLYFGGNAEEVIYNAPDFAKIFAEHTVYLVNYRGYGGSSGQPTEAGIYSDAEFIFDALKNRHSGVSVMGRSLGSGVATYLASKRSIQKLLLVTPYDSIQSVAQGAFPFYPMGLLLKDKYDSLSRVKDISAKTLVIIAEHDEVIRRKHSERLAQAFPKAQIQVEIIENAAHNTVSENKRYYSMLDDFLQTKSETK